MMSETEMNSYRFNSGEEPSDEMLAQIMHEAAVDAKNQNEKANHKFFEELRMGAEIQQAKWAERINEVKNGDR
ncbi:MAG: hypothetical protein K2M00_02495 [Muribaculaceae bacterium]|nr:hypothetical protein [Muribaculaceae bacterium]